LLFKDGKYLKGVFKENTGEKIARENRFELIERNA